MIKVEMSFKDSSIITIGSHFVQCSKTICEIFEEVIIRNILNLGQQFRKDFSIFLFCQPFCSVENYLCNLSRGHHGDQLC